ncbi:MAG: hypothetical protein CME55_00150 [Halieaceae bacterium]|nr:hypothetical protein [Halieaceae bacterium]
MSEKPLLIAIFETMRYHLFFFIALILEGCAVQSRPEGGPRDEKPPARVEQSPVMGELNWSGNTAEVTFDEYIQSKNLRTAITTTPVLEGIEAEIKGKRLRLKWEPQELLSNTTYRISLGNAVGDLNENNAYPNLQFVWSTGPYIDSLSLQGTIVPSKKTPFDKLNVWLIPAGTDTVSTAVFSGTPDKEGNFSFAYMPARTFDVLVFEDVNFNGSWDWETEPFGMSKDHPTGMDSTRFTMPFFNSTFTAPEGPKEGIIDSIAALLDTAKAENLGHLVLVVPPVNSVTYGWLMHESGYEKSFVFRPERQVDTIYINLGNLLPGKYTFKGFVDENLDSNWTPASWFNNLPGEFILPEQSFELKGNWDLEQPLNFKL